MDSDDNCLVIDETIADMEVSSTSETPAAKDVSEIETHDENEADSSVASTFRSQTESTTTPLNLSTKKSMHRHDDHGHGKEKDKDRHREKRRSKDDRRKTLTPSSSGDKHRSHRQKANCIRLTDAMFKGKMLNVSCIEWLNVFDE